MRPNTTPRAGCPFLKVIQNRKKRHIKGKTAGVIITCVHEMAQWVDKHLLPMKLEDVQPFTSYAIPVDFTLHTRTDCVVLTMHVQINWMGQLALNLPKKFVLHIDGTHGIHHGDWVLVTVGTHTLEHVEGKLVHQFRPLCYMLCKQIETGQSLKVVWESLDLVCLRYFGVKLEPGVCCSDHGTGKRAAHDLHFGTDTLLAGCWPHVAWGLSYGNLLLQSHPLFDAVNKQFATLQRAQTVGMWDVFVQCLGEQWGDKVRGYY